MTMSHENLFALDLVYKVMIMPEPWMRPKCDGDDDWEPYEKYYNKILCQWGAEVNKLTFETWDDALYRDPKIPDELGNLGFIQFLDNNCPQMIPRKNNHFFIELSLQDRLDFFQAMKMWDTYKDTQHYQKRGYIWSWACKKGLFEDHRNWYQPTPKRTQKQKRTREKYLDRKKRAKKND